jgi:hypothetical protein
LVFAIFKAKGNQKTFFKGRRPEFDDFRRITAKLKSVDFGRFSSDSMETMEEVFRFMLKKALD